MHRAGKTFGLRFLPGGDLFKWIELKNRFSFVGILNDFEKFDFGTVRTH